MIKILRYLLLRYFCLGKKDSMLFNKYDNNHLDFSRINNLYIHIPFCKKICPYCPYYKEEYSLHKAKDFSLSLLKEINLHKKNIEGKIIDSLYIGGGSPTLLLDTLIEAIDLLKSICIIKNIAIETNPEDLTEEILATLKNMKCNLISIGIQDFHQQHLKTIGRNYDAITALKAVKKAKKHNFDTVNIDIIFAIPGQTLNELNESLNKAINSKADQITTYPLFTFPYSSIGKFKKLNKVKSPNSFVRRKFYFHICDTLVKNGYQQISVWSFIKNSQHKYSSVTRNYFLGLGPSAATYTGNHFLFNVFDINTYQNKVHSSKLPYSLVMNVSINMEKLYWLYWRLYETKIPILEYKSLFSSDLLTDYKLFFVLLRVFRYARFDKEFIYINNNGIHYIHLIQNYFSLNFINKVWSQNYNNPNPLGIDLK